MCKCFQFFKHINFDAFNALKLKGLILQKMSKIGAIYNITIIKKKHIKSFTNKHKNKEIINENNKNKNTKLYKNK